MIARLATVLVAIALAAAAPYPADKADKAIKAVRDSAGFKAATDALARDHDRIVAETITLNEIPAPPFKEARRAAAYLEMLKAHGLTDVEIDAEGNVMGLRRGTDKAGAPLLVVAAHLDTVFPESVDVRVRRDGTRLMAPGIGDDTHALAVLLGYIRALDVAKVKTKRDILVVGNVGEEGPGDLRGVRHIFREGRYKDRIAAFVSIDGVAAFAVTYGAVGSKRYRVTFKGPGGHSYGAFGLVNPMAALGTTVVELNRVQVPAVPKTTYMTSVIGGGTSVNSIPYSVWLEVDMRSESREELDKLDARFKAIVEAAVTAENAARSTRQGPVTAEVELIGDRPTGATSRDAEIIQLASASVRAAGLTPFFSSGSTDSNIPISLGIPAVTLGSGAQGGRSHALDEWIDVASPESLRGKGATLATILALAGM
jgi:tripeptide aminopeptidase